MRTAIIGAGAMGCLYGGSLALMGHDVTFVDVSARQIEAINTNGLHLTKDGQLHIIRAPALRSEELTGQFDLILLFTKTIHSEKALAGIHCLAPEGMLLSLQNGLGNEEIMAKFFPRSQILIGMTGFPADLKAPGVVESNGGSFTKIMNADGQISQKARTIAEAFTQAGLNCSVEPGIYTDIWEKAIFNSAVNALCAVTQLPVGTVVDCGGQALLESIVLEGAAAAQANGIHVEQHRVLEMLAHAAREHHDHKPSMLQDILAKRTTEVLSINGAIAAAAEKAGAQAPINRTLCQIIQVIQNSFFLKNQ